MSGLLHQTTRVASPNTLALALAVASPITLAVAVAVAVAGVDISKGVTCW